MKMVGRLVSALAALVLAGAPALALTPVPAPPVFQSVDANGVDLLSGTFRHSITDVSIGQSGPAAMSYTRYWDGMGWWTSTTFTISGSLNNPVVTLGNTSDSFTKSGSTYTADEGNGATLTLNSNVFTYTASSGTKATFTQTGPAITGSYGLYASNVGYVTSVTYPNGLKWTFANRMAVYCTSTQDPCPNQSQARSVRLQSVTNSYGYMLKFVYANDSLDLASDYNSWHQISQVVAVNRAVDACDPNADSCSFSTSWPTASYGYSGGLITSMTDPASRTWNYGYTSGYLTGIRRPGAAQDDVTVGMNGAQVSSVTRAGVTTTYSLSSNVMTIRNPADVAAGRQRTVTMDTGLHVVTADQDQLGKTTSYTPDGYYRIVAVVQPEGNRTDYTYDGRGNVTQVVATAKGGGSTITTSASYDASCSNVNTCNQPNSVTDARGNVTNFTYTSLGMPDTVTQPAVNNVSPQTRYGYMSVTSGYDNVSLTLPTTTSTCRTSGSCANGADETRVTIGYGNSGNYQANNYTPLSSTIAQGDGSQSVTTNYGYDTVRNLVYATDPLGHTSRTVFNLARQPTMVIGPDPDDGGPKRPRAVSLTYAADGQLQSRYLGTSDANGSNFTALQQIFTSFDGYGRKSLDAVLAGGSATWYSYVQYSYDNVGRPDCTAVRMNPTGNNNFGSVGGTAVCDLSPQGSFGPDRISRTEYDPVGRVSKTWAGYRTDGAGTAVATQYAWTDNGKLLRVTDPKGNQTTYSYDGFDRAQRTCFTTSDCNSGAPYEELGYDTASNVVSRRLRNGVVIGYGYDALNRPTRETPPTTQVMWSDKEYTYSYDNLGHVTQVTDAALGHNVGYQYDYLGRTTLETTAFGSRNMGYDAAGRLTYLGYGDGFFVNYNYDNTNALSSIGEQGAGNVIVSYGYDDLGRRTSVSRANGVGTASGYDGASRLSSLATTFPSASASYNQTISLTNYNPAGQIGSRTSSNDAYAWTQHYNVNRTYATNALNQYTSISTPSITKITITTITH